MNCHSQSDHAPAAGAPLLVAIEAGGTKFNVGVGGPQGRLYAQAQFETRAPAETLGEVTGWIDRQMQERGPLAAIGVASFGPIDTNPRSPHWGRLGPTPKLLWRGYDLAAALRPYGVPLGVDTDVNGAALGEWRWGAGQGHEQICYLTVGTGIGGGAVVNGKMISGHGHPEMGHMFVRRHPDDAFEGACPSHGDCLEGLASGTAIRRRWGAPLSLLPDDHAAHEIVAYYLAQACVNIVAVLAPERIVGGGGVLSTPGLLDRVRRRFDALADGYFTTFSSAGIVKPALDPISGLIGGLAIAESALHPAA